MRCVLSLVSSLAVCASTMAQGQRLSPLTVLSPAQVADREPSAGRSALAGAGLGLAGFLVGSVPGAIIECHHTGEEWCGLEGLLIGGGIGGTLGMGLGVHLGNRRRGNVALDCLVAAAIWGVGIGAIARGSGWNGYVTVTSFIVVPIAQLAATVAVERAVGRSRARVAVVPQPGGGAMLVAAIPM